MILVDANLLLYAKGQDLPQHAAAAAWLDQELAGPSRVGLPWPSLMGFLRIGTNPRLFNRPLSMDQAWEQVAEWLDLPTVWVPQPTERHAAVVGELLKAANASGNLVSDAHLAAIALEHGLEVCSTDADFARFPGVRWRNPLVRSEVRERAPRYRRR